jgi:hypothetical protein
MRVRDRHQHVTRQVLRLSMPSSTQPASPAAVGQNASLDHKLPISRGGENEPGNIRWVDISVNSMKNDKTHEEFIAICRMVALRHPNS